MPDATVAGPARPEFAGLRDEAMPKNCLHEEETQGLANWKRKESLGFASLRQGRPRTAGREEAYARKATGRLGGRMPGGGEKICAGDYVELRREEDPMLTEEELK